jgi:L-ascorbate metabolism protein UlaG (beta-lactamase superfamily)
MSSTILLRAPAGWPSTATEPEDDPVQPRVTFVGHATVLVEVAGLRILTDPVLTDRVAFIRRVVQPVPAATSEHLDLILVSHLHHDHLHVPSLRRVAPGTPVVVPRGAASAARRGRFDDIVEVVAGDQVRIGDVTISVVPALHSDQRLPIGRRAQPVGYLIETEGWSCYFAGDTDVFDDMQSLQGRVDVALLPVWGWGPTAGHGHLDPPRAAAAIDIIRPAAVVPIHWGTLWPIGLGRYRPDRLIAPPHELIDSLEGLDVITDVHLLAPGATLDAGLRHPPTA